MPSEMIYNNIQNPSRSEVCIQFEKLPESTLEALSLHIHSLPIAGVGRPSTA
jgi:hypothetical protein